MNLLLLIFIGACAFAGFGAWIATEKGRPWAQGALIGFLFGPLGALILALLPAKEPTRKPVSRPRGGENTKVVLTAWDIPDDGGPQASGPVNLREDDESRILKYLGGGK